MNKKVILMFLICFIALGNCFAKIKGSRFKITESEKEFDVMYYLTEDMKVVDNKQNEIKNKYKVDKVYPPSGLVIEKVSTYHENILTSEQVYNIIWEKIKGVNKKLTSYKAIKNLEIKHDEFEKTTTMKIKRYAELKKDKN